MKVMLTATQATSTSQQGILTHGMSRSKEIVMWEQEHSNHPHKAQRCPTSAEPSQNQHFDRKQRAGKVLHKPVQAVGASALPGAVV